MPHVPIGLGQLPARQPADAGCLLMGQIPVPFHGGTHRDQGHRDAGRTGSARIGQRGYFTERQSPVFAIARAKHRTARDSASRCATAEIASVSSASAGQETADEGAVGRDVLEK